MVRPIESSEEQHSGSVMSTASDWLRSTRSLAEGAPWLVGLVVAWSAPYPPQEVQQEKARSVSIGIWEGAKFRRSLPCTFLLPPP